jgi:putative IMPACT (imprinted ancient) family translation regulator
MINTHFNIFSINTSLFLNCLEGVTEEQAIQPLSTNTNSLKWLAAHVTWAMY